MGAILNNVEMPQWVKQGRRHVAFSCRTVSTLLALLCTIPVRQGAARDKALSCLVTRGADLWLETCRHMGSSLN